jgi:GTP pyrophosphokinase
MIRQYELVDRVRAYDPNADESLLNRAYVFAMKAHGSQLRHSGDPYFAHPLEVAGILTGLKLDTQAIVTALLHDTIEDTLATYDEIKSTFGVDIANLVDGVTKLSRLELQSEQTKQAENFRKLMVAMSTDIRVLLVKLADRLHNMRTIKFVPSEEKRRRIATETMEIYAPLSGRIGMQAFREELEDLSFSVLNPDMRESLTRRLADLRQRHGDAVVTVTDQLKRMMVEAGIDCSVSGREKRPYSIWRKMQQKSISFEQLSDVVAFRILVATPQECYQVLGTIHAAWRMVPGRFKDYISLPKKNGYQSLHSTVIGPQGQKIELQIRTVHMHDIAENGVAAHWSYKEKRGIANVPEEARAYKGLRDLIDLLEQNDSPEEFLEHTKLEMFHDQVFCFTPKGDLIALPTGATPIDFAYAVHTLVGDTCVGCKINSRHMPLRTRLHNGDQVEILRSKGQKPSPAWEAIAVTGKARAAVRRFIRQQQREQYAALGRKMAEKSFRADGHDFSDKAVEGVLKALKQPKVEDVYVSLGSGQITGRQLLDVVFPGLKADKEIKKRTPNFMAKGKAALAETNGVAIQGLIPGMAFHFAGCCHPLPGDRIVGIIASGVGVTIHTIDCETLTQFQDQPERWLDISWSSSEDDPAAHIGRVRMVVANTPGALGSLSVAIARHKGNISNLKILDRSPDFFEMLVDIEVRDVRHLTNIVAALRAMSEVSEVERSRS